MDDITTVCYGKKESWKTREEAEQFFLQAMMGSDGSERGTVHKYLHKAADGNELLHG